MPTGLSQEDKIVQTRASARAFESKKNLVGFLRILVDIEIELKKKDIKINTSQSFKSKEVQDIS